jgi:hypothetical protein
LPIAAVEEAIMTDRYIKIVLTVIALELFWIGAKDLGTGVAAQAAPARAGQAAPARAGQAPQPAQAQQPAPPAQPSKPLQPVPVVITGIELQDPPANAAHPTRAALPIYAVRMLKVDADRPLAVVGAAPMKVEADKPLPVKSDEPLTVRSVPYTPGRTPGE